jgi:hypothetical protein
MVHLATRIVLKIIRLILATLAFLSPFLAFGANFGGSATGAVWMLGLGFLCVIGASMADRKLRPDVGFWHKRRAAK